MSRLDEVKLESLKLNAISVEDVTSGGNDISKLCEVMSIMSVEEKKPVKSVFNEQEFVIEANTSPFEAIEAWCDQCFLKEKSGDDLEEFVGCIHEAHKTSMRKSGLSSRRILDAKIAEKIVEDHPERVGCLDMMQLMDVCLLDSDSPNADKKRKLLDEAINKYMKGEETFTPNLYNVSYLGNINGFMLKSGKYKKEDIDKRTAQVEQNMFDHLSEKSCFYSDKAVAFIKEIADKYPRNKKAQEVSAGISLAQIARKRNMVSRNS